jgi:hypothetical protein
MFLHMLSDILIRNKIIIITVGMILKCYENLWKVLTTDLLQMSRKSGNLIKNINFLTEIYGLRFQRYNIWNFVCQDRAKIIWFSIFQHYQKSLPRLPIPKLEDTCTRYLAALEPISSELEYKKSEKLVNEFLNGEFKFSCVAACCRDTSLGWERDGKSV